MEENTKANNNLIYILSLFGYIFLISMLMIVYFHEVNMSNYVHYTGCYQPVADYSVEAGKSSNSILSICGSSGQEKCTRNSTSLADAINFAQSSKADKFLYNEKTGFTALLSKKTNYYNNTDTSIYTANKQLINQSYDNVYKKETPGNYTDTNLGTILRGAAVSSVNQNQLQG